MRHAVSTSQPSTNPVKFAEPRPFSDPEAAVRKLIEIANTAEPVQDARIYIERVNCPFLAAGGSPAEYRAGIERAIAKGWLWRHESGTYVKFTGAGAELLIAWIRKRGKFVRRYDPSTWLLVYIDDALLPMEGLPILLEKIRTAAAKSPFAATFLVGSTEQGICELISGTARWVGARLP